MCYNKFNHLFKTNKVKIQLFFLGGLMAYFEVVAKCGHVGRHRYYRGVFFVKAEDGKAAAAKVRVFPRVKEEHKDAILECNKIEEAEFLAGLEKFGNEIYFKIKTKKEQKKHWNEIKDNVYPETKCQEDYRNRHCGKKNDIDKARQKKIENKKKLK